MPTKSTPSVPPLRAAYVDSLDRGLSLTDRPEEDVPFRLSSPAGGHVGLRQAFAAYLDVGGASLVDLGTLPGGRDGQRLVALRYIVANGEIWLRHFAWTAPLRASLGPHLQRSGATGAELERKIDAELSRVVSLVERIADQRARAAAAAPPGDDWIDALLDPEGAFVRAPGDLAALEWLVPLDAFPDLRRVARERLRVRAPQLLRAAPRALDLFYLATLELDRYPATTVHAGQLKYVIVADKGEMGVRAVREAIRLGKTPVVLFSEQDDAGSLQVRLAASGNGFAVGLAGSFRESYANFIQITERVTRAFQEKFGNDWEAELACAALYPGYGPLAENAAAISHFRRSGIVFIGPPQDVVENIGDKRNFRGLAQQIDASRVTPGIVIDSSEPDDILTLVRAGLERGDFALPGRLKAANGGGGRGQAIVTSEQDLPAAVAKVLGEIRAFNWDAGVMFEQNIPETIHLEVQLLRDRYGNTRHFGMRDCSEQRASQKIQEEAPPAILRADPELQRHIEQIAVQIIDSVGYVGAATVELMFKDGRFYFLETNTRIQVEHPVTEESHRILRDGEAQPLNLVALQLAIAEGRPLEFEQADIVATHVAREFRINAESWNAKLKDSRDGKRGLFVPNGGIFDELSVPDAAEMRAALSEQPIEDLQIRFDSGFEAGDLLVNKDPTFGKLIVAVRAAEATEAYELLRNVSIEVLKRTRIRGRQALPNGEVLEASELKTNVTDHIRILEHEILRRHSAGRADDRHVNWVLAAFRASDA
jgi:acetyl/propionyl-CoA carboxylase alpha subunit